MIGNAAGSVRGIAAIGNFAVTRATCAEAQPRKAAPRLGDRSKTGRSSLGERG